MATAAMGDRTATHATPLAPSSFAHSSPTVATRPACRLPCYHVPSGADCRNSHQTPFRQLPPFPEQRATKAATKAATWLRRARHTNSARAAVVRLPRQLRSLRHAPGSTATLRRAVMMPRQG